jgi:hypothetical protein
VIARAPINLGEHLTSLTVTAFEALTSGYLFLMVTVDNPHIDEDLYLSWVQTMLDNPKVLNLGGYRLCQARTVVESLTLPIPRVSSDTDSWL